MYLVGEATGRKMEEACGRHSSSPIAVQSEKNVLTWSPTKAAALHLFMHIGRSHLAGLFYKRSCRISWR